MKNLEILLSRDDIPKDAKETIQHVISKETVFRENEERFRLIAETSIDIIFQTNKDRIITYCSPAIERILGYTPDEIIGTEFSKVILTEEQAKASNYFQHALSGKTVGLVRRRIRHKNGKVKNVEINGSPLVKNGKIIGTQGIVRDITEHVKIEEELRESERKYRTLVERANDGIAIIQDEKLVFLNKQAAEMLGHKVEKMINTLFKEYIHPDDLPSSLNRYQARMAGHDVPSIYEMRLVQKDGNPINVEINAGVITYQNKPANLVIVRDITERKQVENAIKESEEKFRTLAEQSPNMIFINKRGLVVYANKKSEESLGYSRDEFYSPDFNFFQLIGSEYHEKLKRNFRKHLAGEEVSPVDYKLITKDGKKIEAILTTKLIDYEGDQAILGIVTDISKQKQAEKELRLSDEILKQMPAGILLVDQEELKIQRWMGKAEQIFGYSADEAIGKPVDFIHHPEVRGTLQPEISHQIKEIGEFFGDVPCIRKDGSEVPIELTAKTVYEKDGTPLATIGINIDVTERKKAELVKKELEERRDNFVWMTSHELRTPLTVITGYCDLLSENIDHLDQKQRDNMFGVVRRNLDRLERLAEEVTMIAQIERGLFEVKKTVVNLSDFLKETYEPYQQLLGSQFECQICQEDPMIILEVDTERLKQVFDNILDNAIKHTSKNQRKIKVEYEILTDHIRFQVSDNGAGIAPENLERIFDQFVSITTEYSTGGTGIGLYICRKIVETHGGKIAARSRGLGKGTTFYFDLPRTSQ